MTIFARPDTNIMSPEKILQVKEKALSEAERYYDNAKSMLTEKAGKQGDYYSDAKYVNSAYSILHLSGCYDGVLKYKVIQGGMEVFQDIIRHFKTKC